MKPIADALGVSRPRPSTSLRQPLCGVRGPYHKADDEALLGRIRAVVQNRSTYGYRRVTAMLNRERGQERVNHKRVYRVMKHAGLLLPRYTGKPERPHDGQVITLRSDLR